MISSLNRALILALLLSAPQALAQTADVPVTAPVVAPVAAPHETLSATPILKGSDGEAAPDPANVPLSSAAMPPVSINVEAVAAPSIETLGTFDEKNGGLGANVWKGSTRESASSLILWMHSGVSNPTLRDLTERLLLTQGSAPSGSGQEWLVQRVQALIALGSDDKAQQLIEAVPASLQTDALEQERAQLLLLHGDSENACKLAATALANPTAASGESGLWQKLGIFCKAQEGKKDEATLALDLLRETNAADEAFLQDIVHKLSDKHATVKAMPTHWSLFDVAVIRLVGESDKLRDKLEIIPPVALKYIAADASLDAKLREKAANKAEQLGILPLQNTVKTPLPTAFARTLAGDVTALVASLGAGNSATIDADNAVIERLVLDDTAAALDTRRVQRLLSLMEPFGYRVSPGVWDKLFSRRNRYDGDAPPAILIDRLNIAVQAGSKGEVILLSALILNSMDVDKVPELVLLPVIKALNVSGFTKEARRIAYDAVQSYSTH